jgi:hypothetical protein
LGVFEFAGMQDLLPPVAALFPPVAAAFPPVAAPFPPEGVLTMPPVGRELAVPAPPEVVPPLALLEAMVPALPLEAKPAGVPALPSPQPAAVVQRNRADTRPIQFGR